MTKLILLTFVITALSLQVRAQGFTPKDIAPELKDLEFGAFSDNVGKNDSLNFSRLYFSFPKKRHLDLPETIQNYPLLHKELNVDLTADQLYVVQNPNPVYTLRIVEPIGNHHMKLYQPDSSKSYTLQIKNF